MAPYLDSDYDDSITDPFDSREIFDLLRNINDPEHPLTLEQLNVVTEEQVSSAKLTAAIYVIISPIVYYLNLALF